MEEHDKEDQLETLKTDVWTKLPQLNLEELEQVCMALELPIEPSKQGKRSAVYSIVTLHLMSNDVSQMEIDMSLEMFRNVQGALDGIMALRSMKSEVVGEGEFSGASVEGSMGSGSTANSSEVTLEAASSTIATPMSSQTTTTTSITRPRMAQQLANLAALASTSSARYSVPRIGPLREFKIGGTVGKGFKDSLSYATVLSRIKQGKEQGYSSSEVMAAVAKSIKSSDLQDIVENGDLDEETFLEVLKVHYLEKNANSVYNEMCGGKQKAEENEVGFLIRMVGLRKRVEKLSIEEGRPMDMSLLRDSFFSTLATGMKQGAVRIELQSTLRNQTLTDKALIHEVGRVVAKEQQHLLKMEGGNDVSVKEVEVVNGGRRNGGGSNGSNSVPESRAVDTQILNAINDLRVDVNHKLTKVTDDVQDLKTRVAQCEQRWVESATGGPVLPVKQKKPFVRFKFIKCKDCEASGMKCFHCTTCGALDHKRDQCPKKNANPLDG